MVMSMHGSAACDAVHQDKAAVAHECIGCIPPSSLKSGTDIGSLAQSPEIRIARFTGLIRARHCACDTPPRTEA